jgi:hypothetical protein
MLTISQVCQAAPADLTWPLHTVPPTDWCAGAAAAGAAAAGAAAAGAAAVVTGVVQ